MDAFGSFAECLTDADRESQGRARILRGRSIAMAIGLETMVAIALVIWPLMHLGVLGQAPDLLPKPVFFAPRLAPYHGETAPVVPSRPAFSFPDRNVRPVVAMRQRQDLRDSDPPWPGLPGDPGPSDGLIDLGGHDVAPNLPPPARPVEPKPPRVSVGVMDAMLIERVEPEYPKIAQAMRLAGTVRLRAIIGIDGAMREVRMMEGSPILAQAALAAVRQWRYRPTLLGGSPVEVETYITVNFVLQ